MHQWKIIVLLIGMLLLGLPDWASAQLGDTIYEPETTPTPTPLPPPTPLPTPPPAPTPKQYRKPEKGRVAVILDSSGSMAGTGTDFSDVKQSLYDALLLIPDTYASGLRVFDESIEGSTLVTPYNRDLEPLRHKLPTIYPGGGTFIGQSLHDATDDLLEKPTGDNRLLFITDGEGNDGDIVMAQEVKERLRGLQGGFKCHFILFSKRRDVLKETPIGKVAETLGCNLTVPGTRATAETLAPTLLRIFGFDFYWLWIILSALAYLLLIILTSYLVFDTQYAQGVFPRIARWRAIGFVAALLPAAIGAHVLGLFASVSGILWGLIIIAAVILIIAVFGFGKSAQKGGKYETKQEDPFV